MERPGRAFPSRLDNDKLLEDALELREELRDIRRDLHANPELGFQERRTASVVSRFLDVLGVKAKMGVAKTGVVGYLSGDVRSQSSIAIRADMDALPICDKKRVEYASKVPGIMHACGHDGHVSMLLGAAKLLARRPALSRCVKLLFQPAEEGPGGALPMMREGCLENPRVDAVIGFHIDTDLPVGKIGVRYGPCCASADAITIKIIGKGGHGAMPHKSVDAIVIAAHVITAIQAIHSREVDPVQPLVMTIGTICGGYRNNVIADEVVMEGTVRALDQNVRDALPEQLDRVIGGIVSAYGGEYELDYSPGYPPLINDEVITESAESSIRSLLGGEAITIMGRPSMGAEDFSYFAQAVPSTYIRIGAGFDEGPSYPAHSPLFDFDERALPIGSAVLARIALDLIKGIGA